MKAKLRNLALTLLASTFISATPVFAANKNEVKQLTLANKQLIESSFIPKPSNKNVQFISRVKVKIYTYANAPKNIRKNYEKKCAFNNIKPMDTDMIMEKEAPNSNSLNPSADIPAGQCDYVDTYYFRDSDSIETAAHLKDTDHYFIGYATIHRDYVGYGHITSGNAVYSAQSLLVHNSYYLDIDGLFGPDTDYFVNLYQSNSGLEKDGIVGPQTWYSLMGMLA